MKVLVTGDKGVIGKAICSCLRESGDEPIGYDIVDGYDVLDYKTISKAASKYDLTVYLAAVDDQVKGYILSEYRF